MSQTPDEVVAPELAGDYVAAWDQITRWTEEGRSFSGREKNCCFLNLAGQRFADTSAVTGLNFPDDSRGVAVVDWDHDGLQDLWVSARTAPQIRMLRNLAPQPGHYLSLRLQGTAKKTNRDAIGAKVEVITKGQGDTQSVKELHAGEGYLSQSTKWIHFGLGPATEIESVQVTWPGGEKQAWSDISVDHHYVLEQANPKPREWTRPTTATLTVASPTLPEVTSAQQNLLVAPVSMPDFVYQSAEGQPQRLAANADKKQLVLLWASWCRPCIEELKQLAAHQDELSQENIVVLALSIDDVDEQPATFDDALSAAKKLQLPFTFGRATKDLLDKLQSINDDLFMAKRPLPLPSSFLIAPDGRLNAIYKGTVTAERILADAAKMDLPGDKRLDAALRNYGLGGVWQFPPRWMSSTPLVRQAKSLLGAGKPGEAQTQLRLAIKDDPGNAEAHFLLGVALLKQPAKSDLAEAALLKSIELAPKTVQPRMLLADVLLQKRRLDDAAIQYEQVVAIQPIADAHSNLAVIEATRNNQTAAIKHFQSAVHLDPENGRHLANLGKALLDASRFGESIAVLEKAVATPKPSIAAMLNLSRILASAPDSELRDGQRAVSLARRCADVTKRRDPVVLDRLAAAYAETKNFSSAIATIDEAIRIAKRTSKASLADEMSARRKQYKDQKPLRMHAVP